MDECVKVASAADKAVVIKENFACDFCGWTDNNILKYGPKYQLGSVRAHYYCVLLSNNLKQNGEDDEGMLGFLLKDIKNELKRCSRIKCIYCGKNTASILCKKKYCNKSFHLPCGLKMGTLHQFKNFYDSYCHRHKIVQFIPKKILKEAEDSKVVCCICYDQVPLSNKTDYIWAPCCQKTWYHKKCLQRLALSAGYFFRCATCNNSTKFIDCVLNFGVFIPQQDASWELVPNAFSELLFKYEQCDAEVCKCPEGRSANSDNSIWEVILCKSCGSQGIHIGCKSPHFSDQDWECPSCQKVTEKLNSKKSSKSHEGASTVQNHKASTQQEIFTRKRHRANEEIENFIFDKRKKCKNEMEEEDDEIDVVTVEMSTRATGTDSALKEDIEKTEVKKTNIKQDLDEVLASVKPGPLSFKLRMIENYPHLFEYSEKLKEIKSQLGNGGFH